MLEGPKLPDELAYVWKWFSDVSAARVFSANAVPQPISWAEYQAWIALSGIRLSPWEIQLLRDLDFVWRTPPAVDEILDGDYG